MDARRYLAGISGRVHALHTEALNLVEEPNPHLNLESLAKKLGALVTDLDENVDEAIENLTTEKRKPE